MSKALIVNKFLYPNGGSETYIFELGKELIRQGHEVQYFGMHSEKNVVGNHAGAYTSNMDFHTGRLGKLLYPFKIIYSREARKAIRKVLNDFDPDVVHLNNFNYQLTPSIIYEVRAYQRKKNKKIQILYTAHDYQLVCPNHMLRCPKTDKNCEKCVQGSVLHCAKNRCIHGSLVKSILGSAEAGLYRGLHTYREIDTVICPTKFMQNILEQHPDLAGRTEVCYNFSTVTTDVSPESVGKNQLPVKKEDYVLYFGRYSKEKGIETLVQACKELSDIRFVFAGKGPLEELVNQTSNIENHGFLSGDTLKELIQKARFSIYPSEWYENCPFSVMESIQYGTPVLGARIGGIPELIDEGVTGELFESGNLQELKEKICMLWEDEKLTQRYSEQCLEKRFATVGEYAGRMREF